MAARVASAAASCGSRRALAVASMLSSCAAPENVWTGRDLHRVEDGELFDGVGSLWACGSRLCPSCSASLRRRARRRARAGVEGCRLLTGEHWRFITLTAPTIEGASLLSVMAVFQRAWSLLRKRQWWRERVRGGVKGVEWTEGQTGRGYHVHLHLLVCGRWIEHQRLREEWTGALLRAWSERGLDVTLNTRTGQAIVDIRFVRSRPGKHHGASVSFEHALQEVCKYICKSEAWDSVPDSHLVEVAEVRRWPRLFELFGATRDAASVITPAGTEASDQAEGASLDTQYISDGSTTRAGPVLRALRSPDERAAPLRDLIGVMEPLSWKELLAIRVADARSYRKALLSRTYPFASFYLLSGESFGCDA
jgi:replication protein